MPRRRQPGRGVVVVDGKLVENLHVLDARRVVELADAIASWTRRRTAPAAQ